MSKYDPFKIMMHVLFLLYCIAFYIALLILIIKGIL
jgi:hypothetical protein